MADRFGGVPVQQTDRFGGTPVDEPQMRRSGDTISARDFISQGASGFNEGLADLLRTPVQSLETIGIPAGVTRAIPPFGSLDAAGNLLQDTTVAPPIDTAGGRIARRAGQEVAQTLPLATGVIGAAGAAGGLAQQGGNALQRTVQQMLAGVRATPGAAATGELAAATGAGLGAGIAGEVAPDSPTAEVVGQLAGGFAPTVLAQTPTAISIRLARGLINRLSPQAVTRAAQQEAAKVIGPELTPTAEANLAGAQTLQQDIPGFTPSLAEATQSQGLLATQRAIEARATGQDLEAFAARRQGNVDSVARFAQQQAPEAPASPAYVVDVANARVTDIRADLEAQSAANLAQRQDLAESLPSADRASLGATIRDRLTTIRRETSTRMTDLANELGINDADVTVQFDEARQAILQDFSPGSVFEDARNFPEVLDVIRTLPEGQPVTFGDLKALRERLTDDLLDAQSAASPSRKRIRVLASLQQRVDGLIDDLTQVADPDLAARYQQFRETYFNEYIEPFERGAAFSVRQRDGRGFYRTPDENVAAAFFTPRNISGARQFRAAFGDDPDAQAALASAALDSLRDSTVRDGIIDPRRLEGWLRAHESVLREFPEILVSVSNVRSASQALSARQAQLDLRTKQINDSLLGRRLQSVSRGTQTPEQLIEAAIRDPRQMQSLVASLRGDQGALESLRRHVWDTAADLSPQRLGNFLENNAQSLARVFDTRHLSDLQRIQRARELIESVPAPQGQGFQPDPTGALARQLGSGIPQIQSRVFAAESGRTSFRFVLGDMFARFIRGRSQVESEALLREALYNPEVAKDLGSMIGFQGERPAAARRLNAWLFNIGMGEQE